MTDISDAELVYEESSEQIQQNGVFFSVQKSITFVCQYSLDDQSLEANFQIAGKDMEFNRVSRGELIYTLVPTAETVIGDDHHFQIIPATPNVIYSRYGYFQSVISTQFLFNDRFSYIFNNYHSELLNVSW